MQYKISLHKEIGERAVRIKLLQLTDNKNISQLNCVYSPDTIYRILSSLSHTHPRFVRESSELLFFVGFTRREMKTRRDGLIKIPVRGRVRRGGARRLPSELDSRNNVDLQRRVGRHACVELLGSLARL